MNKQEVYAYLQGRNLWYEVTEHDAVYNMEDVSQMEWPYPEGEAKNLFVRDDKRRNYYLITVQGEKRVDLKEFRKLHQLRPLTFASPEELETILGLIPGAVTPLGVLNDEERKVFLDEALLQAPGLVGVHPNENTATVWMKTRDLIDLLREHGNEVETVCL